jgi:hypothetical protein
MLVPQNRRAKLERRAWSAKDSRIRGVGGNLGDLPARIREEHRAEKWRREGSRSRLRGGLKLRGRLVFQVGRIPQQLAGRAFGLKRTGEFLAFEVIEGAYNG